MIPPKCSSHELNVAQAVNGFIDFWEPWIKMMAMTKVNRCTWTLGVVQIEKWQKARLIVLYVRH